MSAGGHLTGQDRPVESKNLPQEAKHAPRKNYSKRFMGSMIDATPSVERCHSNRQENSLMSKAPLTNQTSRPPVAKP